MALQLQYTFIHQETTHTQRNNSVIDERGLKDINQKGLCQEKLILSEKGQQTWGETSLVKFLKSSGNTNEMKIKWNKRAKEKRWLEKKKE